MQAVQEKSCLGSAVCREACLFMGSAMRTLTELVRREVRQSAIGLDLLNVYRLRLQE